MNTTPEKREQARPLATGTPQRTHSHPPPKHAKLTSPHRSLAVQRTALTAFFGQYLTDRPTGFLDHPGNARPELEALH
ncbi:hypothetical protein [Streptomyces griseus]|uniref:hypothetical protein n=1 Tax=Streptomyces griseus TaxID=1911 RepID=UPI0004C6C2D1|nr:hypothetical protein [Streptomyces griseus]